MSLSKKLSGHRWQFPGGAEYSYQHVIRSIQNDPRLSKKRKAELIEDVTFLCGHILNDVDGLIRSDYTSAHSSGIKYLRWKDYFKKPGWILQTFCGDILREMRMNIHLEDLSSVGNVIKRLKKTADRLEA